MNSTSAARCSTTTWDIAMGVLPSTSQRANPLKCRLDFSLQRGLLQKILPARTSAHLPSSSSHKLSFSAQQSMSAQQQPHHHEGGPSISHNLLRLQSLQSAVAILFLILFLQQCQQLSSQSSASRRLSDVALRLAEPGTAYRGTLRHTERMVAVETLGETKFARCDVHTVMSEDGKSDDF
mmetsp:Transcript_23377/g.50614  ORF Transcript_23377/g.50614 Transcript_23377/m.50614 type:complete len:180 (-) Transcript_23377:565-1104(-)